MSLGWASEALMLTLWIRRRHPKKPIVITWMCLTCSTGGTPLYLNHSKLGSYWCTNSRSNRRSLVRGNRSGMMTLTTTTTMPTAQVSISMERQEVRWPQKARRCRFSSVGVKPRPIGLPILRLFIATLSKKRRTREWTRVSTMRSWICRDRYIKVTSRR